MMLGALLRDGDAGRDGVADAHRAGEAKRLAEIDRTGPWQLGSQDRRDEPRAPHAMSDDPVEHVRFGIDRVEMRRIHVA